jgi:hypothetical protein
VARGREPATSSAGRDKSRFLVSGDVQCRLTRGSGAPLTQSRFLMARASRCRLWRRPRRQPSPCLLPPWLAAGADVASAGSRCVRAGSRAMGSDRCARGEDRCAFPDPFRRIAGEEADEAHGRCFCRAIHAAWCARCRGRHAVRAASRCSAERNPERGGCLQQRGRAHGVTVDQLAAAIRALVRDPGRRSARGVAGRECVAASFLLDPIARNFENGLTGRQYIRQVPGTVRRTGGSPGTAAARRPFRFRAHPLCAGACVQRPVADGDIRQRLA